VALTNGQTRETLANDMWQACKILRRRNTLEEPMKTTPAERFDVVLTTRKPGGRLDKSRLLVRCNK
jgi:hypothetical protein